MKTIIKLQGFTLILVIILMLVQASSVQSQVIFGNNAEGTLTDPPASTMCAIRYQCSQSMTATKMYAKIAVSGSGNIKCAIYSDSIGNPGTFLMGTNELTNPGTGWKSFDLASGLVLTSGAWYHLVLWTDNTGYLINYTENGVGTPYRSFPYGPWPDSFGTAKPWAGATYCIYAEGTGGCTNPAITAQPQNISRVVGTLAIFNITANGTGLLYQWGKGGTDIPGATLSSYTISSVVNGDAGNYTVVVSGECGSPVTSNTATLVICDNPAAITDQPQSIERNTGTSATFSVTATGEGLTYQWNKGGINIPGATNSSYTISSVAIVDAGNYFVVVSGACGSPVTSNAANLTINSGDYIIQGQTYTNSDDIWDGVNIERATKKAFYFLNNSVTSINGEGYMLQAGDEGSGATNNNLDGSIITGNKFTWTGTDMKAITHGVFMGYNINNVVKYNYLKGVPYGLLTKSGGMDCTSGGIAYNIVIDAMMAAAAKGINGVRFFNNTFYSSRTMAQTNYNGQVYIYANDGDGNSPSTNCKVFNNIFYTVHQIYNVSVDQACLPGFECDYNIYYCEAGTPIFRASGVEKTFAQWQALGYDTHSVVVNPNFIGNTYIPSVPLFHGKDMGSEWKEGLSPSAEWGTSAPAVANQDSIWQCGAYIVSPAPVADYYVAPYGNDNNPGTISAPFYSLHKAWSKLATTETSGKLIYMRGGTYFYPTNQELRGKNGSAGNLIKIWAYPGENPVITKASSGYTYTHTSGIYFTGDYFHWKGIEITGFTQITPNVWGGMRADGASHNIFETLNVHHNGHGFACVGVAGSCDDNLFLNCDFHHNYDPITSGDPYGNADGLEIGEIYTTGVTNTVRGCRSWSNSDDGYDMWANNGFVLFDGCWAWENGYQEDGTITGGNGAGYKLGKTDDHHTLHLRTVQNCLAFHNREGGFSQNEARCTTWLFNNTAYHNADGADVWDLGFEFSADYDVNVLRNNVAHANQHPSGTQANYANCTEDHNTWDGGFTVADADFVSLDATGVDGVRQADGSLPSLGFLKLAASSDLIDAGVDVGLPFNGTAPDLGAIETDGPPDGISSLEIENGGFRVYPNPVSDILYISSNKGDVKEMSLKLYDIKGIELYVSTEAGDCKLDISRYQPGVYFLQIICEGKTTIRKIMKY